MSFSLKKLRHHPSNNWKNQSSHIQVLNHPTAKVMIF